MYDLLYFTNNALSHNNGKYKGLVLDKELYKRRYCLYIAKSLILYLSWLRGHIFMTWREKICPVFFGGLLITLLP